MRDGGNMLRLSSLRGGWGTRQGVTRVGVWPTYPLGPARACALGTNSQVVHCLMNACMCILCQLVMVLQVPSSLLLSLKLVCHRLHSDCVGEHLHAAACPACFTALHWVVASCWILCGDGVYLYSVCANYSMTVLQHQHNCRSCTCSSQITSCFTECGSSPDNVVPFLPHATKTQP